MKKQAFIALLSLFIIHYSFSQTPPIEWQQTIGGNGNDWLYCLTQTTDGGYVLGGSSSSSISGDKSEGNFIGGLYNIDYWIVKINASGDIQWQNTIGGTGDDWLKCIEQTSDGGFILGGYSFSNISGDKTENCNGVCDYWIIKTDSNGNVQWQNTIGGNSNDYLYAIQQTTDGGYILGGSSFSNISGDKTENRIGGTECWDYWVVKTDAIGNILWQNTIGGKGDDNLYTIEQITDGGYILGGTSRSKISGDKTEMCWGAESNDYWLVKIDAIGNIQWQNTIGGLGYDVLLSTQQTSDGGYILGGTSSSGITGDKTEECIGATDYWIVKTDSAGSIQWQQTMGGSDYDTFRSIEQTADGGYILGGYSRSDSSGDKSEDDLDPDCGILDCYTDYWIVKTDASGNLEWENTIGGYSLDELYTIQKCADGGYILGGYSSSGISGDKVETGNGYTDYWIIKLQNPCLLVTETCNLIDDNCNGFIDEGIVESITITADGPTTFCKGGSVLLSATYTGTTLQWKKNAINIPGAIGATYTATATGDYTCETTSVCGTAISTLIHVTVNKNPSASITAGGATTFCAGGSVTLNEAPVGGTSYQWYKGAEALAGATSTNYIATTAGNYKCRVTKTATGCFKNSNTIMVSVPCRDENNITANNFNVYPNPAKNFITIETKLSSEKTIYITNTLGQILQTIITSENTITINLNNFNSGVYFIRMEDGVNLVLEKFVKR